MLEEGGFGKESEREKIYFEIFIVFRNFHALLTMVWCGVLSSLSSLVVFTPSGVGVGLECRCMSSDGVSGLVAGGPMLV